jgi:C4-type Zn-finger protein
MKTMKTMKKCPKCNGTMKDPVYCAGNLWECPHPDDQFTEHLFLECSRCHYKTTELCTDAKATTKEKP